MIHMKKGGCVMRNDYEQFDIVLVDLGDDFIDGEQGGVRPCIIVQNKLWKYVQYYDISDAIN